jgi:hypothetical protein
MKNQSRETAANLAGNEIVVQRVHAFEEPVIRPIG